jgi:hypothetical protein
MMDMEAMERPLEDVDLDIAAALMAVMVPIISRDT